MRLLFIWFVLLLWACDDKMAEFTLAKPEPGLKNVLVEEFTGARCPNCPQGAQELENLKTLYGDQLIIISIHAGDFVFPYPESSFDFRTPEGDALLQILGNPIGYPSAVINRVKPDGQNQFQQFSSKWGSSIDHAFQSTLPADLEQNVDYDPEVRNLQITITILPLVDIDQTLRLSVVIVENNIIDYQADRADPDGIVPTYVHNHVLRKMLSEVQGDDLGAQHTAFSGFEKKYMFTLPPETSWWKDEDLKVITFLSLHNGESKEVVQAVESPLIP